MAYNAPPPLTIADTAKIELRIDPKQTESEIKKAITLPGELTVALIQISNRMQADITGDKEALTISNLDPEIQAVSGKEPTIWRWLVKPLKEGTHLVFVKLYAQVMIDGSQTPMRIGSYEGRIVVNVSPRQHVENFVQKNWQWLWTAILVPVGGFWWKRRTKKDVFNDS
ncbi:hypothetical protein BG58_03630 [Caballeronia jiangsuensis]|nr:hypothetical protein BG58_03630 [Caballeronia jiangsuensis]